MASNHLVWSEETYRICGVSKDVEPTFEGFMGLIPSRRNARRCATLIERSLATRVDVSYECHLARPDGSVRLIQGLGRAIEDKAGPCGWSGRSRT